MLAFAWKGVVENQLGSVSFSRCSFGLCNRINRVECERGRMSCCQRFSVVSKVVVENHQLTSVAFNRCYGTFGRCNQRRREGGRGVACVCVCARACAFTLLCVCCLPVICYGTWSPSCRYIHRLLLPFISLFLLLQSAGSCGQIPFLKIHPSFPLCWCFCNFVLYLMPCCVLGSPQIEPFTGLSFDHTFDFGLAV